MVVQMDFSGKMLWRLSILGERNVIFPAPKLFCGRQYNQVPLSPILIVGRREGRLFYAFQCGGYEYPGGCRLRGSATCTQRAFFFRFLASTIRRKTVSASKPRAAA